MQASTEDLLISTGWLLNFAYPSSRARATGNSKLAQKFIKIRFYHYVTIYIDHRKVHRPINVYVAI